MVFLLIKLDLTQIYINHSIFILIVGLKSSVFSVFANNIKIIALKKRKIIKKVKQMLIAIFFIVDMRSISFCQGLKID